MNLLRRRKIIILFCGNCYFCTGVWEAKLGLDPLQSRDRQGAEWIMHEPGMGFGLFVLGKDLEV